MLTIFDVVWWCLMSGVVSWQLEVVYSMFHSCRASPALHSYPFYFLVSRQYSKNHWINFRSKPPNSLNAFYALPQVELLDFPKMYKLFDVPVVKIESKCWWRSERDCLNPDAGVMPDAAVQALFFFEIHHLQCLFVSSFAFFGVVWFNFTFFTWQPAPVENESTKGVFALYTKQHYKSTYAVLLFFVQQSVHEIWFMLARILQKFWFNIWITVRFLHRLYRCQVCRGWRKFAHRRLFWIQSWGYRR